MLKKFKRLEIAGEDFDMSLTIKAPEIVQAVADHQNEAEVKDVLNTVLNGFAEVFLNLQVKSGAAKAEGLTEVTWPVVYLAGPMEFAKGQGNTWRKYITKGLEERGIEVLNPCKIEAEVTKLPLQKNIDLIFKAKKAEDWAKLTDIMNLAQDRDYQAIDQASFMIVYLDHSSGPGGTYCEVEYAKNLGIPIYGVCLGDIVKENSWILTTIIRSGGKIFHTFIDLLEFITLAEERTG